MSFESLGLSTPILKAVKAKGYTQPSPIQAKVIPIVLSGKDLMATAQTGTGKTAGFTLPILEQLAKRPRPRPNQTRVLILTPTRELAAQVHDSVLNYSSQMTLSANAVFGGVKIQPQMRKLRRGTDILVATPGRLLDLYQQNAIRFDDVETLVLDEADRMLDMGFIHDIKKIQSLMPSNRQTLLFSATFSKEIRALAKTMLKQPLEIDMAPKNTTADTVEQHIHPVDKKRKTQLLSHLLRQENLSQVLVFSRTKHGANKLVKDLYDDGIAAAAIHGNKSQAQRTKALADFKKGKTNVLVATDIAARGIDIDQLPHVINFDLPDVPEDYVHRIGRTGRAGANGEAISLVSPDQFKQLRDIERLIGRKLTRRDVEGFVPAQPLPEGKDRASKPRPKRGNGGKRPNGFAKNGSKANKPQQRRFRNSEQRKRSA